ncbi:sortase [Patescibacteria group bacterium]
MALYRYVKAPPVKQSIFKSKPGFGKALKLLPYISVISGLTLLLIVSFPFISYKMLIFSKNRAKIITPVSEDIILESKGFIKPVTTSVLSASDEEEEPEMSNEVDLGLINNWFPSVSMPRVNPTKITHYTISIPKLDIEEAVVTIGGVEVKKTLIHYAGTAIPGEYGNTVIFGHSVLPIFYNPENYESIFSTIPTLEKGDEIFIYFDGIEYTYLVEDYFEVKPDEISVLEQRFNERVLSLITCVPPGSYLERGVIKARLRRLN